MVVVVVRGLLALLALGLRLGCSWGRALAMRVLVLEPCEFVGFAEKGFEMFACACVRGCATLVAPRGAGAEGESVSCS